MLDSNYLNYPQKGAVTTCCGFFGLTVAMMTAVKFNLSMIIEEDVAGVDLDQLNMSLEMLVIPNIDK